MPEPNVPYSRALAGERSTPPEDVGGTMGYENYLAAYSIPTTKNRKLCCYGVAHSTLSHTPFQT
jgi:Plasmid pRiA4b ORF-3-like protein